MGITYKQQVKDLEHRLSLANASINRLMEEIKTLQVDNKANLQPIVDILTSLIEGAVKRRLVSSCTFMPSTEETLLKECRERIQGLKQ
jgi:hypothetical protein